MSHSHSTSMDDLPSDAGESNAPRFAPMQTTNLSLAAFQEDDIEPLFTIMSNHTAMQFTYKAPSLEHHTQRLRSYAELESTLGYAPWTVRVHGYEQVIGWGGLNIDPFDPDWGVEVAYCFAPSAWGKGYGTELVRASLEVGFVTFEIPTIVAFTHPENIGSARVLEKNGFVCTRYIPEMDRKYYELERSAWLDKYR